MDIVMNSGQDVKSGEDKGLYVGLTRVKDRRKGREGRMRKTMEWMKRLLALLLCLVCLAGLAGAEVLVEDGVALSADELVEYGLDYSSPGEVSLYLHAFCELPPNYLTKEEARAWGWVSARGNLWEVAWGMSIGGDVFGNRERLLPDAEDRIWYECDVNYEGGYRGAERLLFSNDGLIYYSPDHYQSAELLYEGWFDEDALYNPEAEEEELAG